MKKSNNKFKAKTIAILSLILISIIGLTVFTQVHRNLSDASGSGNDKIADGTLEFQAVDINGDRVAITSAPIGKDVTLHVALTTSAESHSDEDYVIKMDNADFVIDGLRNDGDYIQLNSNGNIITVTIDYNQDKSAYDLIVTGWKNGTTLSFDLGGHKNSENKTTVTMTTNSATHGGMLKAEITAYGDIEYSNMKTVNHDRLSISSDGTIVRDENGNELSGNLTYILKGNLEVSNSANATINGKINVSDVLTIPSGIDVSDLDTLKNYLTVSGTGLTEEDISYTVIQADSGTNNIRQLKITYTLDSANEITDFLHSNNYTIDLDIANLIKEHGTNIVKGSSIEVTNDLTSEYVTKFDIETADKSTVITTITKDEGPVYNYDKEIISVNNGNVTEYVKKDDTITYKMTIDNTGIEAGTINYIDYIPANTEFISASVDTSSSVNVSDATFIFDENSSSVKGSATIGANGKLVLLMTVKVTNDSDGNISNTFFDKTVTIPTKKLESYKIEKNVDKNWFPVGDPDRTLTYTLKVSNTGGAPLTDKTITDTLPNGIKYISANVGDNTDVSVVYENGTVTFSGINLQPGETKEFTINCEVDGTVTGFISNTATFMDSYDWAGVSVEDPFDFRKYVNKIEDGKPVTDPKSEIEANNGDSIEYTMKLTNDGADYNLTDNNVVMEDIIPSTISWDQSNVYYTIGEDNSTHYTPNITTENVEGGVKLIWNIDSINGNSIFTKGTTITLHVLGTVNIGKVTETTIIKNTAKIPDLKKESTANIKVIPDKDMELEKYVYKIFDENGNLIYENTKGGLETDESKIPLVGENYTVVYRVKVTNESSVPLTEVTLKEQPDNSTQIGLSNKYYDPTTKTVITGSDPDADAAHIRVNVYDNNNTYNGTFTTSHIDWWGGGVTITTKDYNKRNIYYELWYSEGVDSNGFSLEENETKIFEFSLVTTSTDFQKVTNTVSNDVDTVKSETLYGKKTVNDINKTVALTPKSNVSTNQNFVDALDILSSKLDENYLIYKVTFNTKGWINDELELTDVLNPNFSYVTEGVEGYDGLPIISITNELDEWNTATLVKDEDNDTDLEDTVDEYSVEPNGNTMKIKIKPSKNRKEFYKSTFTVYYLVKSNGTINNNTLSAKNTATIIYKDKSVSDTAIVNVIKEKSYPGITKNYEGAYGASTTTMEGYNPKLNNHANENSRLVWKFKITNDKASNAKAIEDYTISDVLPVGYEYDNLYGESSYTETKYYPSFTVVKAGGSTTYSAFDGTYIEPTYSTTVINGETRNVVTWHFDEDAFKLEPGEYIEFHISCKLPGNEARASVAVNDVYLMINGDYETDSNDDVTTFEGKTALHAQDYVLVGSANVTTSAKEVEIFEEGQEGYDYGSSNESSDNKIKAIAGEDIKYTLNIKNDSPSYIGNIVIIDRLPYVGDKYLSTEGGAGRESAFSIKFKEISSVQILDIDGNVIRTLNNNDYQIGFSDYKGVIPSERADWNKGGSEVTTWHSSYNSNSDVNMRIAFNDDIQLDTDQSIRVIFKATVPEGRWIESSGSENISWNNFAYNRTAINKVTGEVGDSLVAESAKVGVWVDKLETQITVNKVWDDNNNFHGIRPSSIRVQLMKRTAGTNDSYVPAADPITLSGNGNTWGTIVSGLPMYENGNLLEYTFIEVDENGSNPGNIDNYTTIDSIETTDDNGYKVVTITNKERTGNIEINKIVKSNDTDISSSTNETFYFALKDTTTNKYVLHDENNKVSSYEYINSLSTYNNLQSALWTINPSVNKTLAIDNLILGRTYQVIETNAQGIEITNSNSKYIVTYNTGLNHVTEEDKTYNYSITNTLKLINFNVIKVWDDENNDRKIRPSEITVQLYANGVPVEGKTKTISVNNALDGDTSKWSFIFEDLRKTDDQGNEINYTVKEIDDLTPNYQVTVGDATNNGSVITQTITNKEMTGQITVTKRVMNYGNDITSTANGKYYFIVKEGNYGYVKNDGTVSYVLNSDCIYWVDTGANANGVFSKTISKLTYGKTYTIIEVDENGNEIDQNNVNYTIDYENQNINLENEDTLAQATIINTLKTTEKTVNKKWVDSSNKHNVRPESVELQLYADGEPCGDPVILTGENVGADSNTWIYTFTNLKKYKDDGVTEIVYTIRENNLDSNYTKDENELIITNTEITGEITVTKQVMNNSDDITSSTDRTFYFILEQFTGDNSDGYVTSNGQITNDKSKAIFSIKTGPNGDANYSKTISGLAINKTYKVIEVNSDGNEANTDNSDYIVGYDNNQTITLTNSTTSGSTKVTNTLDTANVVVNKIWDDNDGANGFRPDSIFVQLYADGQEYGEKIKLPDENGIWSYTWDNLKKYKDNGTEVIKYTVKEFDKDGNESIKNYIQMPQAISINDNTTTISITNKEALGGLTISKYVLNTQGNAMANIPDEFKGPYYITLVRKDNGNYIDADGNESEAIKTITLNAGDSITIPNIPLTTYIVTETDISGNPKSEDEQFTSRFEIIYSNDNREVTVDDSSASIGFIVYNKIIEKTKLDVTKIWQDNNNLHGLRPESITVKLYRIGPNGTKIDTNITKTITAPADNATANTWTVTFENLDKYDENGNEIKYTADEVTVPTNYVKTTELNSDVVGTTNDSVIITNTEESKSLTVTKKYLDNKGVDITATSEVTFNFIIEQSDNGKFEGYVNSDGKVSSEKTVFSITTGPNSNGNFSKTISNLTKDRSYKVIETNENGDEMTSQNSNFEVTYTNQTNTINELDANTIIINKLKSTSLKITKRWIDNEDHGLRKDIVITLKANGNEYGKYTLTQAENWTITITGLPEYANNGKDKIVYTVEEDTSSITNYEQEGIEEIDGNEIIVTNREITGTINITKQLLNNAGEIIQNVSDNLSNQVYYVQIVRESNKKYLDADGNEHVTPQKIAIKANQTKTLTNVVLDTYTITELDNNGDPIKAGNSFSVTDGNGNNVNLTVSYENSNITLSKDDKESTTIIKNKISDNTNITINKVWNDQGMNLAHRPISLDVVLYANSVPAKDLDGNPMKVTLTNENKVDDYNWSYTFTNLPLYDENGNKINYTISEENLKYTEEVGEEGFYSSEVDQSTLTITNTPQQNNEKVRLTIKKEWSGNEHEITHRPENIVFIIRRADTKQEVRRLTLTEEDNWYYECNDLPKYNSDLYEITYEVYELIPENDDFKFYDVSGATLLNNEKVLQAAETNKNEFKITNIFDIPDDKVSISVIKIWSNIISKYEDTIPSSITIKLVGTVDEKEVVSKEYTIDKDTYQNSSGTQWNYVIDNLPKYDDTTGGEISYKVTETPIDNFELIGTTENYTGDEKFVTFENKQLTGELTVSKTVINSEGANISGTVKLRYYFTVTYTENGKTYYVDLNGNLNESKTVLSIATGTGKAATIKNLLLDKEYVVTETDENGNKLQEINGDYVITNGQNEVTLTKEKDSASVEIINTLKSKKITVTKYWDDNNDKYGKRPSKLAFILYKTAGDVTTSENIKVDISECKVEGNSWTYEINNLPRKDDTGTTISYKLVEDQNSIEWYYLTDSTSNTGTEEDKYTFTNKEIVGNYSLQLLKVDENNFVIPGMKFDVNGEEYETDKNGRIVIIDRKEIFDNQAEKVTIKEISDTSVTTSKRYVKLAENVDLYISKQRVENECRVTGISFDGNSYGTSSEVNVLLVNGTTVKIEAKVEDNDITVKIVNIEQKPDLSLKKFITKVNDNEITSQVPEFTKKSDGTYTYTRSDEVLEVENNDLVTYTIRVYNEGNIDQYANLIEDQIPQGLEFVADNEINIANGWSLIGESTVITSILSEDSKLLKAYIPENMDEPDFKDLQIVLKVVEPENSDRIVTNKAQIMSEVDKDRNEVNDIDSTPGKWIDGEDDQDWRSVRVKYFDLSLSKYVTKVIVINDGKETIEEIDNTAENGNSQDVAKIDLKKSEIDNTIVKVEYGITVKNEGELPGAAKEIADYIPDGFKFAKEDNINWYEKDGKLVTNELENAILQPGESATVKLILTWENANDNMGLKTNEAEISIDYNESNTPDRDSTPGNRKPGEDDTSTADVMITVKTGNVINYLKIASYILATLGVLALGVLGLKKLRNHKSK